MTLTEHSHGGNNKVNRRHQADRRHRHDQREEARFEPNVNNRRQKINRRRTDTDPWQAASHEH